MAKKTFVVEMTSNLFWHARHHGVVIPEHGETVEFEDEAAAESLIASGHAKWPEVEDETPEPVTAPAEVKAD